MLTDFQQDNALERQEADLVIVGSGPAGISVALPFLKTNKKVLILEGGGLEYSEESQNVYRGEMLDRQSTPLDEARLRFLGGTSNHWTGNCRHLEPEDFEERPYLPHSGWPIGLSNLSPYLEAACDVVDIGAANFDLDRLPIPKSSTPALDPAKFNMKSWRISPPTLIGEKYADVLAKSRTVHLIYNASATNMRLSPNLERVESITVQSYDGSTMEVSASRFVLALGGSETPRFLLNCRDQIGSGIGNTEDLVGRYWMDHLLIEYCAAVVGGPNAHLLQMATKSPGISDGDVALRNKICASPELKQRHGTLGCAFTLEALPEGAASASTGYKALREIVRKSKNLDFDSLDVQFLDLFSDLEGAAAGVGDRLGVSDASELPAFGIRVESEQQPNPDSRIVLTDEKDRFGMNRIGLDWKLTELDLRTIHVGAMAFAEELARLDIGRTKLNAWLANEDGLSWPHKILPENHHMGTTRMSDSPRTGVVDLNCKVHGLDNLYVAGSSVFPTGGTANPTLTIVQLALRLGEHVKTRLAETTLGG